MWDELKRREERGADPEVRLLFLCYCVGFCVNLFQSDVCGLCYGDCWKHGMWDELKRREERGADPVMRLLRCVLFWFLVLLCYYIVTTAVGRECFLGMRVWVVPVLHAA